MQTADPDDLHPTTWAVLRALRAGMPLSRNRHFDLYRDPNVQRARRLHRWLQSIIDDVRAEPDAVQVHAVGPGEAAAGPVAGRYALRVDFPRLNGHRTAYLSAFELTLLADHAPAVAALLAERLQPA